MISTVLDDDDLSIVVVRRSLLVLYPIKLGKDANLWMYPMY
jgi:hypothetical protein